MTSMTSFQVDRNNLTGTLPLQYASWTNVSRFLVNNNALLTGSIPDAYSSWGSNAIDLRFSFCNFTGTLPTSWAFDHINMLLFSENQLSGTLPSSFGGMKSISILSLDGNDFSGTLPASWSALTGAQVIGVRNNTNLSGPIPPSWSAMTQLAVLALCFTAICGNASMFALIGLVGFGCPETSAIETFSSLATTELVAYVIQLTRVTTVSCTSPASTTHIPSSAPSPNKTEPSNASSASVLPYTAAAKSAATAAVWTVAATQGLKLSGGASPAASVAFLQGAFAASRLRRLCTANSSTSTEDSPPLSDPMDNPTEIELTDAAGNYAGGAIVGNSSLLVAVILLNQLAVFIRSWRRKRSAPSKVSSITTRAINWLVDHLVPSEGIHFPGSAAMVYGLLMPPTVAACVVIFMNSTGGSEGVGAGAYVLAALLGIVVWILPLGYLAWRMQCSPFPFTTARHAANKKARRNFSESKNTSLWRRMFSSIAEFLFTPTHTWKLLPTSSSSQVNSKDQKGGAQRAFYKSYGVFFVGTRSEWRMLFALELFIALVGGAVQGAGEGVASSGDAADACSAAEWTSATLAALSGVVLVLHVVVWPCLVRYDDLQTIVLTALTVASEIASAIGGDVGEQVGNALSLAAAVIQVILVVLEIAIALLCFEGRIRITSPFSATIPNAQPPLDFGELRLRLPRIGTDYQLPSIAHSERPVVNNHHSHDSALCASPQQHQQYVSLQQIRLKQLLYMVAAQHHHRCRSSKETKGLKT